MSTDWYKRVKKLAFAYESGWEYIPGSDEAGSVLTDAFLEMEGRNRDQYRGLWKKHELEFLQAVPESDTGVKRLRSALVIMASGEDSGKLLKKGTKAYTVLEKGEIVRFRTCSELTLTSAAMQYGIYRKGFSAWLVYDGGAAAGTNEDGYGNGLFQAAAVELACPVFEWAFDGLCDGRERIAFTVEFYGFGAKVPDTELSGRWTVTDGQNVYPLSLERKEEDFVLCGETPGFAERLDGGRYAVRLELPAGEEPGQAWMEALCGDIALREAADALEPGLCLTDEGTADLSCVRPFGRVLNEASCCYFACDGATAGREGKIVLKFTEGFETEEKLPETPSKEHERLYRKYPWMRPEETVREWRAQDTVWEYFNGNLWHALPESAVWNTGCDPEKTGERVFQWTRPRDMQPCAVEGEVHFYLRLRLISVYNAYAAYYHKYVPVMRNVRFETEERILRPVMRALPESAKGREMKLYLGFDEKVTPQNSWYTGKEHMSFTREQIKGQGVRYGKEAFWVEVGEDEAKNWEVLMPNFVEILQEKDPDDSDSAYLKIPAAADFSVETDNMEVLDAVSVSDSRYDGGGPPIEEKMRAEAAKHYFSHFGRLVTLHDMDLMLQERYPFLRARSCSLREDTGELQVALEMDSSFQARTEGLFMEIREWLQEAVSRTGPLWMKGVSVKCTFGSP